MLASRSDHAFGDGMAPGYRCREMQRVAAYRCRDASSEALAYCWSMIFSENRCPLFGIMLSIARGRELKTAGKYP
jgi:hypothetical protein